MKQSLIDLPVLLIFFTRPDHFNAVFEKVKQARPSTLFLACDGPRKGNVEDKSRIQKCKQIAESVDWNCKVYKNYSDNNMGCGVRPYTAIEWALSLTDRIVILEDDCIPEDSFFPYMQELLERYKDDERIGMISGLNHFVTWNCGKYSYCFTKTAAIWGWGTWRRVWDYYDYSIREIEDSHLRKLLVEELNYKRAGKSRVKNWFQTFKKVKNQEKLTYWDNQFGFVKYAQSLLGIVPKQNLICNIGVGDGSTHAGNCKKKKWKKGQVFFMPTNKIDTPLDHPPYVMCDRGYDRENFKKLSYPNPFIKNVKRVYYRLSMSIEKLAGKR